jgi:hypothetical protein
VLLEYAQTPLEPALRRSSPVSRQDKFGNLENAYLNDRHFLCAFGGRFGQSMHVSDMNPMKRASRI